MTVVEHHSFSAKYKQDAALGGAGRLGQRGERRRRRILLIYFWTARVTGGCIGHPWEGNNN